jgi:hypothetical protein
MLKSLFLYIYIYTAFIPILERAGKCPQLFTMVKKYHDRMRGKLLYHQADVRVSRSSPPFLIDKRRRLGLFRRFTGYPTPCISVSFRLYSLRPTSIRFPLAFNSSYLQYSLTYFYKDKSITFSSPAPKAISSECLGSSCRADCVWGFAR